jgi:hypothetical protein
MALLIATRTAQDVLSAYFQFNFDDTMADATDGTVRDFGETSITGTYFFEVIPLPPNAVVVGGEVSRQEAFDTAGYAIEVGDATDDDRYLASTDLKAVGATALVPTGYVHESGENIRISFTNTDVCTTGKAIVRVDYIVLDRACEVQIA